MDLTVNQVASAFGGANPSLPTTSLFATLRASWCKALSFFELVEYHFYKSEVVSSVALAKEGNKRKDMYYVYILKSLKDRSNYIGITTDLKKRVKDHNYAGAKFTTPKRPYKLIWYTAFIDKIIAYRFEKYLKTGSGAAFLKRHLV